MADNIENSSKITAEALWYIGEGKCAVNSEGIARPTGDEVLVKSLFSGISRGTESLVSHGLVPQSEWQRMRAPFQSGEFSFPVKYGYANVGKVLDGPDTLLGQTIFSLFPHQNYFCLPSSVCVAVPDHIPPERAALAANMETALNALWDGKPSPGDHICVVGGGVVGLLTAYLCQKIPGTRVALIDTNPQRAAIAAALDLEFAEPHKTPVDQDIVFHTSASVNGLRTALGCAGKEASVIEMSWYGSQEVALPLGAVFHSRRLKLISSQVGSIAPERQNRWTYRRRLETAISLLDDPVLDQLISHRMAFHDLPEKLPELLNKRSDVLAALVVYDRANS